MNIKTRTIIGVVATGMLSACGSALATTQFTQVNPPPSGEKNHRQILNQIYGGYFNGTGNGRDYSNGSVTAMRLADKAAPTPTNLTTGVSGGDSFWVGGEGIQLTAKAKYAADNSIFGWFAGDEGGSFQPIFNTSNLNATATVTINGEFRWALKDLSVGKTYTSNPNDNSGVGAECNRKFDQLVTYKIIRDCDNGPVCEWVLFWEDRIAGDCSDYDYNDSVICVTACPIPTPAAGGLAAMGGLMVLRRRRR